MGELETGVKYWSRYVVVPLLGGGGVVAVVVALLIFPSEPNPNADPSPTIEVTGQQGGTIIIGDGDVDASTNIQILIDGGVTHDVASELLRSRPNISKKGIEDVCTRLPIDIKSPRES